MKAVLTKITLAEGYVVDEMPKNEIIALPDVQGKIRIQHNDPQ